MPANSDDAIIALDVGDRRIGVAVAQLRTRLAQPQGAITVDERVIDDINQLATQQGAVAIVVGLPRSLDGDDTAQTRRVREFAEQLKKEVALPLYFQDEALTSRQAEEELSQRKTIRYNKEAVDALAATYILTDFLAEHRELS